MKGKKKETERGRAGKSLLHLPWRYRGETALILTGILLTGIFSLLVSYYFSPIGEASGISKTIVSGNFLRIFTLEM